MTDRPLPPELQKHFGHLPDIKYRGSDEWSSACPKCGGAEHSRRDMSDRFRMFDSNGPPRGWCRQCDYKVFANSGDKPTQAEIVKAKEHQITQLEKENKRLREKIAWLQEQNFWREWHFDMKPDDRGLWYMEGIEDPMIDIHKLGYTNSRYPDCGGAMTIPYVHTGKIQTVQFRLIEPPNVTDKYRFLHGTRASWFYAWPDSEIEGVVLVVEGVKKALVIWQTIARLDKFEYQGRDVTIVATPSKHVPSRMIKDLDKAELVIWLLDPDAMTAEKGKQSALMRNAEAVGLNKSRVVQTVAKIDDMILEYDIKGETVANMVKQASPIIRPRIYPKRQQRYA
jgi:hypothetical protein